MRPQRHVRQFVHAVIGVCAITSVAAGCASGGSSTPSSPVSAVVTSSPSGSSQPTGQGTAADAQRFPDIVAVEATASADSWTFTVTVSSPYDSPQRYADGWRVVGPDGTVYGEHVLTHDHAAEQPFTRTQSGVTIPTDVRRVTIEGRDMRNGYGGATFAVDLGSG